MLVTVRLSRREVQVAAVLCGADRLRFRGGDEFGSGCFAEFSEQCDRGGPALDGSGFDAIRAIGDAVCVTVQDSQHDETFAGADRDHRWDGREDPRIGQHLQGRSKAQLVRPAFARQRRLQHRLADEIVGQQARPEFLPHGGGSFSTENVEFHRGLDVAQFYFNAPSMAIEIGQIVP